MIELELKTATDETAERSRLTVAHALLALVALLAAALRLTELGALPLSAAEVEQALAVWRLSQPESTSVGLGGVSPAYFTFTTPLTQFAGDGDAMMRLVPALAGLALVLLPWLWRKRLGAVGALTASLLLAVSPPFALVARTAGGEAIALFALLLLAIAADRFMESERDGWLYIAFGALGLGLTSAPLFYGGLVVLGLAWGTLRLFGPALPPRMGANGHQSRATLRRAALFGLALFVAVATLFLLRPAGLGAAAAQPMRWLGQFASPGGLSERLAPVVALGRYDPLAVTLGAVAILWATWRSRPFDLFLAFWFAAATLLVLLQPGIMSGALLVALPAYLLIARLLQEAFRPPSRLASWGVALAVVGAGAVVLANGARFLRVNTGPIPDYTYLLLALIVLSSAILLIYFIRMWDPVAALQGSLLGLLLLFLVYSWGTAWWLTHEAANDPRELWVTTGTDDDVRLLAEMLEEISLQLTGAPHGVEVLVAVDNPVLRWYLRDFENLLIGEMVPPRAQQRVIITSLDEAGLPGANIDAESAYFGADLGLLQHEAAPPVGPTMGEVLRWWLFRESPYPPQQERVVLWVRGDALR